MVKKRCAVNLAPLCQWSNYKLTRCPWGLFDIIAKAVGFFKTASLNMGEHGRDGALFEAAELVHAHWVAHCLTLARSLSFIHTQPESIMAARDEWFSSLDRFCIPGPRSPKVVW